MDGPGVRPVLAHRASRESVQRREVLSFEVNAYITRTTNNNLLSLDISTMRIRDANLQ